MDEQLKVTEEVIEETDKTKGPVSDDAMETTEEMTEDKAPIINDDEDDSETLAKTVEKKAPPKDYTKLKKVLKICGITAGAIVGAFVLLIAGLVIHDQVTGTRPDATGFEVDSPDDPNGFTNVAKSLDEETLVPLANFVLQGKFVGFTDVDVTNTYNFSFDPIGYYEGYSSSSEDDFGKWELTSNGDDLVLTITCTEAEDKYKVEILEDGYLVLHGKDRDFTLNPAPTEE